MAVYDILPQNDLHYSDIRDTLNANNGSVNNNVASAFKESANINMWSKHKPVRLATNFCQDFDSSKPNYNSEWWKSSNRNCGITPYKISSYKNLPELYNTDFAEDELNGWTYQLPNGGDTQPLRLADFAGYHAKALPPYSGFYIPATIALNQSKFQCDAMIPIGTELQLLLSDLGILEDCYFGCYIKKNGQTFAVRATSSRIDSATVEFSTVGFTEGVYTAYPFISSVRYNQIDVDKAANYYSAPQLRPVSFEVISTRTSIYIGAEVDEKLRRITYSVDVINDDGTITLTNNYIKLRYADKDWLDPMVAGERQIKLDDYTVSTGTTRITEGVFTLVPQDLLDNCKIWVSLSSGKYLQFIEPMRPLPIP